MLELTTQNFQQEVLENERATLVYFYSPVGCAPCKMLTPVVETLEKEWQGRVRVGKLNIYPNMPITLKYTVMSAPVLILFKDGEPVLRLQGFHAREGILSEVQRHMKEHQDE